MKPLQVPALCAPYLETAISLGLASPAEFHDELARIYLRAVGDQRRANGAPVAANGTVSAGASPAAAPADEQNGEGGRTGAEPGQQQCEPQYCQLLFAES